MATTKDYNTQRRWADKFQGRQFDILSSLLAVPLAAVRPTDDETDMAGVDIHVGNLAIGLRVRRYEALQAFGVQPTIRTSRGRDDLSELDKIKMGRLDYLMLNYATNNASNDNDDDSLQATALFDLTAVRRAALNGFRDVVTSAVEADRVEALALGLPSLETTYGPVVVYRHVIKTTIMPTTTITVPPTASATGRHHTTAETPAVRRISEVIDPLLFKTARERAAAATLPRIVKTDTLPEEWQIG